MLLIVVVWRCSLLLLVYAFVVCLMSFYDGMYLSCVVVRRAVMCCVVCCCLLLFDVALCCSCFVFLIVFDRVLFLLVCVLYFCVGLHLCCFCCCMSCCYGLCSSLLRFVV